MLIAQITDAHVTPEGTLFFDQFDTGRALARAVAALNALTPRPDIVLFTGDLADKGTPEEYAHIRKLLAPLTIPLAVIPGNHDRREAMRAAFADNPWLPATGFLHQVIEDFPLRLIGLDTLNEAEFSRGLMCAGRRDWLDRQLAMAAGRPTVVFMHHPPFLTGIGHMDPINCAGGAELEAVVSRHPEVIRVLCGHVHRPVVVGWGGTIASIASAVAIQLPLDLRPNAPSAFVLEPPAFDLHLWIDGQGLTSHRQLIDDFGAAVSYETGQPVQVPDPAV